VLRSRVSRVNTSIYSDRVYVKIEVSVLSGHCCRREPRPRLIVMKCTPRCKFTTAPQLRRKYVPIYLQPGSVEAASVCEELMQLAERMEEEKDSWTHFTIVTKARLLLIGVYAAPWWRYSAKYTCLSFSSNRIE